MASKKGPAPQPADSETPSFEAALERLEAIVADLEGGTLSLEESLARYEEGVRLSHLLSETLDEAEKRIERLTQEEGKRPATVPLELDLEKNERETSSGEGELPF